MKAFTLKLQDATRVEEIPGVTSFVGEDASGSFGILADHVRSLTTLVIGLARFRIDDEGWRYLALPGAVLYFKDNLLTLSTRHYLMDDDYMRIAHALQDQLLMEEEKLRDMKERLHRMEDELLKRLWEIGRMGLG